MDANPQPMIPADFDEIDTALPNRSEERRVGKECW